MAPPLKAAVHADSPRIVGVGRGQNSCQFPKVGVGVALHPLVGRQMLRKLVKYAQILNCKFTVLKKTMYFAYYTRKEAAEASVVGVAEVLVAVGVMDR